MLLRYAMIASFAITSPMLAPRTANAELMVAPTRVVLENGDRAAELVLVNKGVEEAAFRIEIENRRMLLNGSLEAAETVLPGELFAAEFVRFSPRRVVMQPGERQTVRITFTRPEGLAPGEYRSHLRLLAAPVSAGRALTDFSGDTGSDLSIELIAIRSITIPVIVRVGELDASVTMESADIVAVDPDAAADTSLVVRLSRSGTRSSFGDITVRLAGQDEPVFFARGIAIYTPNTERDVILPLPGELRDALAGQEIELRYESSDPENPEVYASLRTVLD